MEATDQQPEPWRIWYDTTTHGDSIRAVAARIGIGYTTMRKRLNSGHIPPAETIIAIARAYRIPPVAALIDTGHLDATEVFHKVSTEAIADELATRQAQTEAGK